VKSEEEMRWVRGWVEWGFWKALRDERESVKTINLLLGGLCNADVEYLLTNFYYGLCS